MSTGEAVASGSTKEGKSLGRTHTQKPPLAVSWGPVAVSVMGTTVFSQTCSSEVARICARQSFIDISANLMPARK